MRSLVLAALLVLPGCSLLHAAFGFDLTPHAIHCGQVLGIDVWVDGVDTDTLPHMTCEQASRTVQMVRDQGAKRGLWEPDRIFPTYRLEFINSPRLGIIDSLGSDQACGYTLTWSHRIAVGYGHDDGEQEDPPEELHSSGVILMHELLHVKDNGNIVHCHWASKYATAFKGLKHEWVTGFDDLCEHRDCSGSDCWDHDIF